MSYELDEFRRVISKKKCSKSYAALEHEYGVNQYYLWNIINDEKYDPPTWVCAKLNIAKYEPARVCPIHGIVEQYDCRTEQVKPKREKKPPKQKVRYPRFRA